MIYKILILFIVTFHGSLLCNKNVNDRFKQVNKIVHSVDNISSISGSLGDTIVTLGYSSKFDGGGAKYLITDKIQKELFPATIKLSSGYFAKLITRKDGFVDLRQFGAKGNGEIKDREAFKTAIESFDKIKIHSGVFRINTDIHLQKAITIIGSSNTTILGMFVVNGKGNITIKNIKFNSFNYKWNYGIRILKHHVGTVNVENCEFNERTIIYQDFPKNGRPIDSLIIEECAFNFNNPDSNIPITTIQVHCSNLIVKNSEFNIKGIDGCIKNDLGNGKISIINNSFSGKMDEEILDYHAFNGSCYFIGNNVNTSSGGIVRTKPLLKRAPASSEDKILHVIKDNIINYKGLETSSLFYIAGSYNLPPDIQVEEQKIIMEDNQIICEIINRPINFRGLHEVSFINNVVVGKINSPKTSVYISSVKNVLFKRNILSGGQIIAYASNTPSGEKYHTIIEGGNWEFEDNEFKNISPNKPAFYIHDQSGVSISISNNDFELNGSKHIVKFGAGEYNKLKIDSNRVNNKNQDNSKIVLWGASKFKSRKIE